MKLVQNAKTLCLVSVAALGLSAGVSQADWGYAGAQHNPWLAGQHNIGPMVFKQQVVDFDQRLDKQLQRILTGMEKGQLTMREAVDLLREHQEINALERRYSADGRLGPRELADLDRRLDVASQNIRFEKRDRDQVRLGLDDRRYDQRPFEHRR
jgi:hypothetical protein